MKITNPAPSSETLRSYGARIFLTALLFGFFAPVSSDGVLSGTSTCRIFTVEGVIDPVVADYIEKGLAKNDFDIAVIALNTPGGLMESMQDIVRAMLNSPAPVCVWIGPSGGRAASAGVFITVAADFSAMAPATNIGAAHPVQMGIGGQEGKQQDEMMEKVVNDAVAYIQSIARERGRPLDWVKAAVKKSVSIGEKEALKIGIIDFIAATPEEMLKKIDGRQIEKKGRRIKISTEHITVEYETLSVWKDFLHKLANPNIAFVLMIIGVWGIIQEASSPGVGFGAAIGGISLLLAFFAMRVLPINLTGLLLIILGLVLLFLEIYTPTFGILTVGGITAFALGGMMLIDRLKMSVGVSAGTIFPSVVLLAAFMFFVVAAVVKSQKKRPATGTQGMLGAEGEAMVKISGSGQVFVHGEIWNARSPEKIEKGRRIRVAEVDGNMLVVKEIKNGD